MKYILIFTLALLLNPLDSNACACMCVGGINAPMGCTPLDYVPDCSNNACAIDGYRQPGQPSCVIEQVCDLYGCTLQEVCR